MICAMPEIIAVSNGNIPFPTQALQPFQQMPVNRLRVVTKHNSRCLLHDRTLFKSRQQHALMLNGKNFS